MKRSSMRVPPSCSASRTRAVGRRHVRRSARPSRSAKPSVNSSDRRRVDRGHAPPAARRLALRAGHEVGDRRRRATRSCPSTVDGMARRPPPALELARVGPQLPDPLDRRGELGDEHEAELLEVPLDADDRHPPGDSGISASSAAIRSTRPRQAASSSSSTARARRTASASVRTSVSRPRRSLGHEAGPLEHRDVLLHGREAHRIAVGEARDRRLAVDAAVEDVAPRRVGERVEQPVDLLRHVQPFGCRLAERYAPSSRERRVAAVTASRNAERTALRSSSARPGGGGAARGGDRGLQLRRASSSPSASRRAAPASVWKASVSAVARGRPLSTPASASASATRKT